MCRCLAKKCFFTADFTFHSSARDLPYPQTLQRRFTHSSPTQYNYIPSSDTLVITSRRRVRQAVSSPRLLTPFHFGSPVPARREARTCLRLQSKTSVTNFRLLYSPGAGRRPLLSSLGEKLRWQWPDSVSR